MGTEHRQLGNGFCIRESDGLVVSHPVLKRMPFEKAIESWVRSYFPEAAYRAIERPSVEAADICLATPGVVVIQAPKGTGKSKAIRNAVQVLHPKTSVVQITFRRSLAWSSSAMLGVGSSLYSNITDGPISARHHPRLTVVINSINRVRGMYDVVVIDEIVSVLDMLAGTLLDPANRVQAAGTLCRLVGHARTVVIADAMLDASCVDFVLLCRQMALAETQAPKPWPAPSSAMLVLDYVSRIHDDYSFIPHASLGTWAKALDAAVSAGRKIVVPCMTKVQAARIHERYRTSRSVLAYTADMDAAVLQSHMVNLDEHWSRPQILVYSPVITAGCSFEQKHYDEIFFYGHAGLGSVRSAIQMIARVRDIRLRTVHVFISKCDSFMPLPCKTNPPPPEYSNVTTFNGGFMRVLALLDNHRQTEVMCSEKAFSYYFWSLVVHSGAKICFPAETKADAEARALKLQATDQPSESAVASPPVLVSHRSAHEYWWAHKWHEAERHSNPDEDDLDVARAVSGTLLERACSVHADHVWDNGLMGGAEMFARRLRTGGWSGRAFPHWVTTEQQARYAQWCMLMMQKAATFVLADGRSAPSVVSDAWTWKHECPLGVVVRHVPACCKFKTVKSSDVAAALQVHANAYLSESSTWMDVSKHCWILAGHEATGRQQPQASLADETMPTSCICEGLLISTQINDVLASLRPRSVRLHAQYGNSSASPYSFDPACAIVDVLVGDIDGRFHLVQCRPIGFPEVHAYSDMAKLRIIAAAEDLEVASLNVLYMQADVHVQVRLDVDERITRLDSLARSSPAYVRSWSPCSNVHFAYVGSDGMMTLMHGSTGEREEFGEEEKLPTWPLRRWITWGCTVPQQLCSDVQDIIRTRLGIRGDVCLDVFQANASVSQDAEKLDGLEHLKQLYLGLCKRKFMVYFWNGRPVGLPVSSSRTFSLDATASNWTPISIK